MKKVIALLIAASGLGSRAVAVPPPGSGPWIRVNQVGYRPDDSKVAVLSGPATLSGTFRVGDFEAPIGPDQGAWGPFAQLPAGFLGRAGSGAVSRGVRRDRIAGVRHRT